jgi:hypothetical protein
MPACPYGAEPNALGVDTQVWLDRALLAADVSLLIRTYAPAAFAAIAASLVDMEQVCAENPDLPSPITLEDILRQTASTVTAGALADPVIIQKAYAWLKYQQFLTYCQCLPPPATPGNNCTGTVAPFTLPSLGSLSPQFPITVDQALIDSIPVEANGDWTWNFQASANISGAATTGNDLFIEYLANTGVWVDTTGDLQLFNSRPFCWTFQVQASVPRFGQSTAIRVRNGAGGSYTVSNFNFCWCPFTTTAPPLPVQPPLTGVPAPPALVCGSDDLCAMVTELAQRLTVIATQISDIQAQLGGTDVLSELGRITLSPEGQSNLVLGTRAVSVELTALGDEAFTSALGNPRGLMRVGSIRWFDGTGYSPRRFIDADRFDDVRPEGALAVSWQLLPGTTGILKFLG